METVLVLKKLATRHFPNSIWPYRAVDALTPHLIRANLETLGINDMTVSGVLHYGIAGGGYLRDGREVGRAKMLLSDLCNLRYLGMSARFGVEPRNTSLRIEVEQNGQVIGYIDSDGRFHYEAASDLRTALGWWIATDGGRVCVIKFLNLDQAAAALLDTIRHNGEEVFYGPYFAELRTLFSSRTTSRFGDSYCSAATILWQVATRELFGEKHNGSGPLVAAPRGWSLCFGRIFSTKSFLDRFLGAWYFTGTIFDRLF